VTANLLLWNGVNHLQHILIKKNSTLYQISIDKNDITCLDITLCDKVCQWLMAGQWVSPGTLISSSNKTDCHDITQILLKVALNTVTLTLVLIHRCSYSPFQLNLFTAIEKNYPWGTQLMLYFHVMYKWWTHFLLSVNFILQNKGVQDQSWPKLDVDSVMLLIVKVT
jgi:hypothetical protein